MKDFDAILNTAKPGDTITLDGGVYFTKGNPIGETTGPMVKPGITIIGGGSVLQVQNPIQTLSINAIEAQGDITIEDLTLDLNGTEQPANLKRNGIASSSGVTKLKRVSVIGAHGSAADDKECFPFFLRGDRAEVEDCSVFGVAGDYISAINARSGFVRRFKAIFPREHTKNAFYSGLNFGDAVNLTFEDCVVINGTSGFYTDEGSSDNVTVMGCQFINCDVVTSYRQENTPPQALSKITFKGNYAKLSASSACAFWAYQKIEEAKMSDLVWLDNIIEGSAPYILEVSAKVVGSMDRLTARGNVSTAPTPARNAGGRATNLTYESLSISSQVVVV